MPVMQQEEGVGPSLQADRHVYFFENYRLDAQDCRLWHGDASIALPPKTFDILHVLIQNAGQLIEKKALLDAVWPNTFVEEGNLSVHISALRKVFSKESPKCEFIETVPKRGYRFAVPVSRSTAADTLLCKNADSGESFRHLLVAPEEAEAQSDSIRHALVRVSLGAAAILVVAVSIIVATSIIQNKHRQSGMVHAASDSRPLTGEPGVYSWPSFSPKGNRLAYAWSANGRQSRNIYLQNITSDERERLTDEDGDNFSPAWSPGGQEIAFLHHSPDDPKWLEVDIAEMRSPHVYRRLTIINNVGSAFHDLPTLAWSPDGKWLLTTEKDDSNGSAALELISVQDGRKQILTHPPALTVDDNGIFSPNGNLIAFIEARGPSSSEIYTIPTLGGSERNLPFQIHSIDGLTWSPDGQSLVVASSRAMSIGSLWKVFLNGNSPIALSGPSAHTADPVVSSAAHRLAYVELQRSVSLWRMPVDGHGKTEQLIASQFNDSAPDYSPDGSQIAFISDRTGATEIWVSRNDGTQLRRITHIFGPMTGSPRWSPDGRILAFDSRFQGKSAVFIVNASGGTPVRVTTGAFATADNEVPSWSHDGKFLYFSSNRTGRWEVWRKQLNGVGEQQITTQGGFNGIESPDGKIVFYVKDTDKTTIWQVSLNGGGAHEVSQALGQGMWGYWTVVGHDLFYMQRAEGKSTPASIFRIDLMTSVKTKLGQIQFQINENDKGLAVSPDGRWLLYAQRDVDRSSIMLAENWY